MALPAAPLGPRRRKLRGAMGTSPSPRRQAFPHPAACDALPGRLRCAAVPPSRNPSSRRTLRVGGLALLALLLLPRCATNGADEIAALQRENARLRGEIEALRGELAGGPAAPAEGAAAPQLEQVFVPRSRVSVEVTQTSATGKTMAPGKKQERASFALPDGALGQVATAISVHFEAGAVEFDLSDEHLAAVAARVGTAQGAGGSR